MVITDPILTAYVECALWSTNADHLDPEGTGAAGSLEDHFDAGDLADDALSSMAEDVAAFVAECGADLEEMDPEQVGHDFWLTRNRHGAGFWDRGLGERGDRLTAAARAYGTSDLYAGDDGRLHI